MLRTAVVLFILGVSDSVPKSKRQSLGVRAILLKPLVVLVEVVDLLDSLELLLEFVFNLQW